MSILEACIEKHLVPSLEIETRRELIRIGKEAILEEVSALVALYPISLVFLSFIDYLNVSLNL